MCNETGYKLDTWNYKSPETFITFKLIFTSVIC